MFVLAKFGLLAPRKGPAIKGLWILGFAVVFLCILHFSPLPDSLSTTDLDASKVLLASNGDLLSAKIASDQQWRFPSQRQLPEKYKTAVINFEDKYFYYHPGINPLAIFRAIYSNYTNGRVVSGGSTITMQLARLLRNNPERSYKNKLVEALIAVKLEWHFSKSEILAHYASRAPFGGNTVGIGAASWRYFGRYISADTHGERVLAELSWAEAALLAVLPNSPALIHPGRDRDKLKAKRDRLLHKLYSQELISENEYTLSVLEPLPSKPNPVPRLADHLLQSLSAKKQGASLFHTTLKSSLQKKIIDLAEFRGRKLGNEGVHNLSIVVVDNKKMHTVAYLGNKTTAEEKSQYGESVDIASKPRSTGSVLKPLLFGAMLQNGNILPETLVADVPVNYKGFTPENYDHKYRGAVPAKEALARSLNIPAVNMLKSYGVPNFHQDLKAMGMTTLFRSAQAYGLSLILGGAEGTLVELTNIYAEMVNTARDGWDSATHIKPVLLVDQPHEKSLMPGIISQGASWLTLEALQEVVRPGTDGFWKEFLSSQKISWKTGTSYGLRDAWAIGSNGNYTVGVWAGNAGGEGVPGLSGLNSAAPTLFHVFDLLGSSQWLDKPEFALKELNVCEENGYLASNNCVSKIVSAPVRSHFQKVSPHHKKIHLDKTRQFRVHGGCEAPMHMVQDSRFVLPPLQAAYWRKSHYNYQDLEPWRDDCIAELANYSDESPIEVVYPLEGGKIYIPLELNGKRGKAVFRATHRNPDAQLFWHIDKNYLKETTVFHSAEVVLTPGWHKLVLVDNLGVRLERWFKVLDKEQPQGKQQIVDTL